MNRRAFLAAMAAVPSTPLVQVDSLVSLLGKPYSIPGAWRLNEPPVIGGTYSVTETWYAGKPLVFWISNGTSPKHRP